MKNRILVLSLLILFCSGCAGLKRTKQLRNHQNALTEAATSDISAEAKLDLLLSTYVNMMDQSLDILDPRKAKTYVESFATENKVATQQIIKDIQGWQNEMTTGELLGFGLRMTQKPYIKQLFNTLPEFEKKFKQLKFAMGLTNDLSGLLQRFLKFQN